MSSVETNQMGRLGGWGGVMSARPERWTPNNIDKRHQARRARRVRQLPKAGVVGAPLAGGKGRGNGWWVGPQKSCLLMAFSTVPRKLSLGLNQNHHTRSVWSGWSEQGEMN